MTKIKLNTWGWFYLVVVLDWYTKEIVGYSLNRQSKTQDWLDALDRAVNKRYPEGIRENKKDLFLISDNGCQPTSENFMKRCSTLGIKQIFTAWSNQKGNSDTERVLQTIKEERRILFGLMTGTIRSSFRKLSITGSEITIQISLIKP